MVLVCAGLAGCSGEPDGSAVAGKLAGQNLLVITLDTTRADRLGCYGYDRAKTPWLDAVAGRGTLFENAYAQVPLTLPSHSSIMTGRYPREHGVRDNGRNALGDAHPTLASIFKERGYATGAFIASFVLDSRFGLERGFDVYSDDMGETTFAAQQLEWQQPANVVTDRALEWLQSVKERPFFGWIHYYDAHRPYMPPQEFRLPDLRPYDGELAFIDTQVKRVFEWLAESKLTERTLVVIVGDHGEAFGEHGEHGHSNFVYDVNIKVPLIFAHPVLGTTARRVGTLVEALEVFPTVLDLFGFPKPEKLLCRSLAPALAGSKMKETGLYAESLFVYNSFNWAEQRAWITPQWKYVSSTHPQLFDRKSDPNEKDNVIIQNPKIAQKLLDELKARYESMPKGEAADAQIDAETLAKLASIGYTGGRASTVDEFLTEGLPDPKDRQELLTMFRLAMDIIEDSDRPDEFIRALPLLKSLTEQSPGSQAFHFMLGACALQSNRPDIAVEALKKASEVDPTNPQGVGLMAGALAKLNQHEEAIKHYEASLELDDKNAEVHFRYAESLLRLGREEEALAQYRRAIELFPEFAAAHARLGTLLAQKGPTPESTQHLEKASQYFSESLVRRPKDPDVHFRLGLVLESLGRTSEAITSLQEALKIEPRHGDALLNLGLLLEKSGQSKEAEETLRRALQSREVAGDAAHALGILLNKRGEVTEALQMYELAVSANPPRVRALEELASYYIGNHRLADAVRVLGIAVANHPQNVRFLNTLAKLLATSQDAAVRDGKRAVVLASKAVELTGGQDPVVLGALASAHAETGTFEQAVETCEKALTIAREARAADLTQALQAQCATYRRGEPYRDPRY